MEENKNILPTESEIEGGKVILRNNDNPNQSDEKGPKIRRGKVDSLTIYEVTESELEVVERGSPSSTYLNIGIALVTLALSFLTTLLTVDLKEKQQLYTLFTLLTIVGLIVGFILLILWWRTKNDVDDVLKDIRSRVKE